MNKRNQKRCMGTNNCAIGCTSGAKQSTLVSYIPRGIHHGLRLFANSRVDRVLLERGRAVGVVGRVVSNDGSPGYKLRIRADVVVVSGGSGQSPALLFRSGLARVNRNIGANLMLHPNAKTVGIYDQEIKAWQGVHQNFQVHEFLDEGLLFATGMVPPNFVAASAGAAGYGTAEMMARLNNVLVIGALVEDTHFGRIYPLPGGGTLMTYSISDHDFQVALRGVAMCAQAQFETGARKVLLPFSRLHEIHSPDEIPKIFTHNPKPNDLELFTVHLMGTCRISRDPAHGVVNEHGESHDVKNLFVADASLFPSPIGLNPMETIMALSTKVAAHLIEDAARYFPRRAPRGRALTV
jgi:choline dehydrogenase-like flavoprotein